jgi:DNA mismatch endonuclease, patch repair protein
LADVFSVEERSRVMARVRSKDTTPERRLAAALKAAGVRFRRNVASLPGTPDFVFRAYGLVTFVHGCFWHGHLPCGKGAKLPKQNRAFWRAKIERNRTRDRKVARLLRDMGFGVLTVFECSLPKSGLPARLRSRLKLGADVGSKARPRLARLA